VYACSQEPGKGRKKNNKAKEIHEAVLKPFFLFNHHNTQIFARNMLQCHFNLRKETTTVIMHFPLINPVNYIIVFIILIFL